MWQYYILRPLTASTTHVLTRLVIENFKCFKTKQELEFDKINIIYGPSGTGKSTIVHAIRLVLKTYLLDPPLREPDYSVSSIEEMLPDKDVDRKIRISLEGKLLLPYLQKDIRYDIALTLSISDGTLTTGVEIEDTKIPQSEMLQAMFSYVIREHTIGKYSIKFEAHYLTHSIYNVRVVYPRVTLFDKELFIVLYQDIFPRILENNIHIVGGARGQVDYSFKPMIENEYFRIVKKLFVDPHVKYLVSEDLSKVLGRRVLLDLRRLERSEEFVLEDLAIRLPVSSLGTSFVNLMHIFTELESLQPGGTLIVDDFDAYLSDDILERTCEVLVRRSIEKDIQLILIVRSRLVYDSIQKIVKERYGSTDIGTFECVREGDECKIVKHGC